MGSKRKKVIADDVLDALLSGEDAKEAFNNGELLDELKRALAERALNAEMDAHLVELTVETNAARRTVLTTVTTSQSL